VLNVVGWVHRGPTSPAWSKSSAPQPPQLSLEQAAVQFAVVFSATVTERGLRDPVRSLGADDVIREGDRR